MFTQPVSSWSANRRARDRSFVYTAPSSPYGESFASSSACFSSRNLMMGAIGPNVSSRLTRGAALAGAQVAADDCPLDSFADIGVREDDLRSVATELEHHVLARRALGDRGAGLGRPDETHPVDQRMPRNLIADLGPGSGHQVERAGRKIRLGHALHQRDRDHAGR